MLICNDTIEVLKNYAEINQSLLFNQGSTLKTVNEQTNVMSKCTVNEAFPQDFAIYDLNKFLGVLSLFVEPELTFSDTSMTIKSSVDANNFVAGDQIAEYQFANKSLFEDEQKILAKEIELPSVEAEFSLEEKYLQQIKEIYKRQLTKKEATDKIEKEGFLVSKKLLSKEGKKKCLTCGSFCLKINDDISMVKYECCYKFYIEYVEGREDRWKSGWRPKIGDN